jgi:hypothetical protein
MAFSERFLYHCGGDAAGFLRDKLTVLPPKKITSVQGRKAQELCLPFGVSEGLDRSGALVVSRDLLAH